MAKVFAPGLSLDAHGSVGKSITFQKRPKGNAIMKPPRPPRSALDNPSTAQQKQRNLIGSIIKLWQESPQSSKDWWNDQARLHRPGLSGYHYFVQELTRNNYNDPFLKLFYKFNEDGGNVIRDSSHNGNDGAVVGVLDWVPGLINSAIHTDDPANYVEVDKSVIGTTGSLSFWYKPDYVWNVVQNFGSTMEPANAYLLWVGYPKANGFLLRVWTGDRINIQSFNGDGNSIDYDVSGWNDSRVANIIIKWNGTTVEMFVNNVSAGTTVQFTAPTADLLIGRRDPSYAAANGWMDESLIWDRYLSDKESNYLYNINKQKV